MNDDELLRGLRAEEAPPPSALDAPLGADFEARVAAQIVRESAPKRRPGNGRRVIWIGAPLAVAAAIALWIARPVSSAAAPLPEYAMEIAGGVDTERGAPAVRNEVSAHPGDTLTFVLRPATDVAAPVEAHVLAPEGENARDVAVETRVSTSGSIELRVRVSNLAPGASTGDVNATIVVARPGLDPVAIAKASEALPKGARVFHLVVHVVERG